MCDWELRGVEIGEPEVEMSYIREERRRVFDLFFQVYSIIEGIQGRNSSRDLKACLIAIPHSVTSDQGIHSQPRKCSRNYGGTFFAAFQLVFF